jgi:RiboL-PSP-HEPN
MPYTQHFQLADDYLNHLDQVINGIADPFIKTRYTGFLAVTSVTVYELAIKDIFIDFAKNKHKVLGSFTSAYFDRINGRIKVDVIQKDYVTKFGEKYVKRFKKRLERREKEVLQAEGASMRGAYANLITWRNDFAHEGRIPLNATYEEVKKSYQLGKHVIDCLAGCMTR